MNQALKSKKGAVALSYAYTVLHTLQTLYLTRMCLRILGADTYGFYQMINSVAHYILILDLGISTTMVRFIAEFDTKKDTVSKENFTFHFLLIVIFLCMVIAAVGFIVNANIENIYQNLTPDEYNVAHQMFLVMIAQIVMTVVSHYFNGIVIAHEHYMFSRIISISSTIVYTVLITIILNLGYGLMGIVGSCRSA